MYYETVDYTCSSQHTRIKHNYMYYETVDYTCSSQHNILRYDKVQSVNSIADQGWAWLTI